nr:hypothetical protein [Angustibacter aerolatus]
MSRTRPARRLRHLLVGVLAAALAGVAAPVVGASPAVADTQPPVAGTPTTVSTDPLPTVQIDGVVWTQARRGRHGLRRRHLHHRPPGRRRPGCRHGDPQQPARLRHPHRRASSPRSCPTSTARCAPSR